MESEGTCDICGQVAIVHLTEINDGTKTSGHFCANHVPAEWRDKVPIGSHRSAADEIAFLRTKLADVEKRIKDPVQLAEFKAELEHLIEEIEQGRRRIGDGE